MLKDKIIQASKLKLLPVVVPEWDDVTVYVRKLSISEVNNLMADRDNGKEQSLTFLAELVAVATTDEQGQKLFSTEEASQLEFASVQRVAEAVLKFNGLTKEGVELEKKG